MSGIMINFEILSFDELIAYIPELNWAETELSRALGQLEWPISHNGEITNVSVVFIDEGYMQQLNSDYREVNEVTDVLSFEVGDGFGEIYICPQYIEEKLQNNNVLGIVPFTEEVLRMIVHGVLHLLGYDHEEYFEWENDAKGDELEEMYNHQETLLQLLTTSLD